MLATCGIITQNTKFVTCTLCAVGRIGGAGSHWWHIASHLPDLKRLQYLFSA